MSTTTSIRLYSTARSSASFRVRIALKLKGLEYETLPVNLQRGEQNLPSHQAINPAEAVPVLEIDGFRLTQSLAIIEYLDATRPTTPALIPREPAERAQVSALSQLVACEIHPINNLRVLKYLKSEMNQTQEAVDVWCRHWCELGLAQLERMLIQTGRMGRYCWGDEVTLADICLVPQIFNAQRFQCDLSTMPNVLRIFDQCMTQQAFIEAQWNRQPDFA